MQPQTDVVDLLGRLVAIDTTSARSNLELVDLVADHVDGIASTVSRTHDDSGEKANLLVRVGPEAPGGIVLCGHLDTVPADPELWTSDPWTLTEVDDRLVARGTADMKGFVALCLDLLPTLDPSSWDRPLWLGFTYDEEVGALGASRLVDDLVDRDARPSAVVIGEPTELRPITAHKGVRAFRVQVTGQQGHSSRPDLAANALVAAARIAAFVDDLAVRQAGQVHPPFVPPYTTFNVASLHAGSAVNIIPAAAELVFEYRPVPADDDFGLLDEVRDFVELKVLPALRANDPTATVVIDPTAVLPALAPDPDGEAMQLARHLVDDPSAEGGVVSFGTDGSHFQAAGMSTVVCGPGSIDVAHRPDEYITRDELADGAAMLARVAERLRD